MLQALKSKKALARLGVVVGIIVIIALLVWASNNANAAPTAKASADITSGAGPLNVTFSSKGSNDPDNDKLSYHWSFGDGTSSTQSNPGKTYESEGKYTVVLKVSDAAHTTEAKKLVITVHAAPVLGVATDAPEQTDDTTTTSNTAQAAGVVLAAVASRPTPVVPTVPAAPKGINLIPNASMVDPYDATTPLHWIKGSWGQNTTIFSYESVGRTDNASASVTMSDYLYGDAKWIFEPVEVTGGVTYTFSDWYKATAATEIVVDYTHTDGSRTYESFGTMAPAADWTQYSLRLTMPATAKAVSVHHVLKAAGMLQVDDYSLIVD